MYTQTPHILLQSTHNHPYKYYQYLANTIIIVKKQCYD